MTDMWSWHTLFPEIDDDDMNMTWFGLCEVRGWLASLGIFLTTHKTIFLFFCFSFGRGYGVIGVVNSCSLLLYSYLCYSWLCWFYINLWIRIVLHLFHSLLSMEIACLTSQYDKSWAWPVSWYNRCGRSASCHHQLYRGVDCNVSNLSDSCHHFKKPANDREYWVNTTPDVSMNCCAPDILPVQPKLCCVLIKPCCLTQREIFISSSFDTNLYTDTNIHSFWATVADIL